jgi:meso-butanediol dehydrogenase/(S,S)-butanediol dehydrogenase/diacetyl reductase
VTIRAATLAKISERANAVFPGGTLTPFHLRPANLQDRPAKISNEEARKCACSACRRMRGEVAYPILWRASGQVFYVTGSVLMVDGGQLAK